MAKHNTLSMLMALVVVGGAFTIACTSPSDNTADGNGGGGGSDKAGSGGKASGGSGGKASGGTAGKDSSGSGGSKDSGGSAGSASAGSAGSSSAGAAGSAMMAAAGAGGTAMMPMGGAMAASGPVTGPGVFFSGADMNISKMFEADAKAGYTYVTSNGVADKVTIVPVDDPLLPAGTKFAISIDAPSTTNGNVILGFNFRENKPDGKWNWFDASAYAGIQFWAKSPLVASVWNFTLVDSANLPMTPSVAGENVGTCPEATRDLCPGVRGKTTILRNTWKKFVVSFKEIASESLTAAELDAKNIGRVDLLQRSPDNKGAKVWMTGVKLLKQDELAVP
jgi:hypothetical protein